MPEYYGAPAASYRTQQLVEYLQETTDIRVVYIPTGVHCWRQKKRAHGSCIIVWIHTGIISGPISVPGELAKELGVSMPALEELTVTETDPTICDLADMIHLREQLNPGSGLCAIRL